MSLAPGVRLGAYEVLALIGRGGMGEVYRARDTKLNRDVALKVLKVGDGIEASTPVELFQTRMEGGGTGTPGIWHQYDVTPDGQRFLVNTLVGEAASAPLTGSFERLRVTSSM